MNHSVFSAADLLLQHAGYMRQGVKELTAAVGAVTAEVHAAEGLLA